MKINRAIIIFKEKWIFKIYENGDIDRLAVKGKKGWERFSTTRQTDNSVTWT